MTLRTAHRNDDKIIGLESLVDLGHVHGLEVKPIGAFHVTALGRKLPITHVTLLSKKCVLPIKKYSVEHEKIFNNDFRG
jgi:hypothetical protein